MEQIKEMDEQELRETDVPWPETEEELMEYINALIDREHDYGTCVYAMSMAAVAAFRYVSKQMGATGFQASCADMDIIRRTRHLEHGFRILDYSKLLYPQYVNEENFPSVSEILKENGERLAKEAEKRLKEHKEEDEISAHPDVVDHWKNLIDLYGKNGEATNAN